MFHSIASEEEDYYSDTWTWDYGKFVKLRDYLEEKRRCGDIKVMTTKDAYYCLKRG